MQLKRAQNVERNSDAIYCSQCSEYREVLRFSVGLKGHITFTLECNHRRVFEWNCWIGTISTGF